MAATWPPTPVDGGVEAGDEVGGVEQRPHAGDAPQQAVGLLQRVGDGGDGRRASGRSPPASPATARVDERADLVGGRAGCGRRAAGPRR